MGETLALPHSPPPPLVLSRTRDEGLLRASGRLARAPSPLSLPPQDFSESPIFTDTVVFRVAPWIMTPSTLPPLEVYVCQ